MIASRCVDRGRLVIVPLHRDEGAVPEDDGCNSDILWILDRNGRGRTVAEQMGADYHTELALGKLHDSAGEAPRAHGCPVR